MARWAVAVGVFVLASRVAGDQARSPGQEQEPPPTFPAEVEQVTVDVVVVDRAGRPVTSLKSEDLEVYEDGVRQTIVSFDAVEVPAVEAASAPVRAPSRVSTNATAKDARRGRSFVILFDDLHLSPARAVQAKGAVAEFLAKETREGDRVTLVAAGGGAWWTSRLPEGRQELLGAAKHLQGRLPPQTGRDRLSDYEAMRIHVFRDTAIINRVQRRFETYGLPTVTQQSQHVRDLGAGTEDPVVTSRAAEVYYEATVRNRATLEAIERALNGLVEIKGRKSLVLVSEGFIYDPELDVFKRIITASRRANTAIYFVNGRGLEGLPFALDAEISTVLPQEDIASAFVEESETAEGSESLAADSGGFTVRNSNDLAGGFKRIADETRAYYLVGYNPKNSARDGAFRKIQVKVPGRKGVQVRARKGYYAASARPAAPAEKPEADTAIQRALDSPYDRDEIPLRITDFVREETLLDKARVFLAAEVDVQALGLKEEDGRAADTLQYLLVAVHRDTGEVFRSDQKVELTLPHETRELLSRTWLPIVRDFQLRRGRYRAKVVVRDTASGKVGTVSHDFEVPDIAQFRTSTPVLSDLKEQTQDGGQQLALLARRDFAQGGALYCQLEVYGAVRLEDSGLPRVSMGYEVRNSDGTLLTRDPPSLIAATPRGAVSRMIGFSLEAAAPGDYELSMRIKDELSGKTLVLREPFRVSAPLPASASGS
jgi:VWFA-related protein